MFNQPDDDRLLAEITMPIPSSSSLPSTTTTTTARSTLLSTSVKLFEDTVMKVLSVHNQDEASLTLFTSESNPVHVLILIVVILGSIFMIVMIVGVVRYIRKRRSRIVRPLITTTGQQTTNTEGEMEMINLNVAMEEQPRNGLSIANPNYGASRATGFHTPNRRMDHLLAS